MGGWSFPQRGRGSLAEKKAANQMRWISNVQSDNSRHNKTKRRTGQQPQEKTSPGRVVATTMARTLELVGVMAIQGKNWTYFRSKFQMGSSECLPPPGDQSGGVQKSTIFHRKNIPIGAVHRVKNKNMQIRAEITFGDIQICNCIIIGKKAKFPCIMQNLGFSDPRANLENQ